MKKVLILLFIAMTFILCSCGSPQKAEENSVEPSKTEDTVVEVEEQQIEYAKDEVINHFISAFNEKSNYEITDIKQGNIRTKFYGKANGVGLEMINVDNYGDKWLSVSISGGKTPETIQAMFDVFSEVIKTVDNTMTEEEITSAVQSVQSITYLVENYEIGQNILITYVPSKELSYGPSDARIDMKIYNFNNQDE